MAGIPTFDHTIGSALDWAVQRVGTAGGGRGRDGISQVSGFPFHGMGGTGGGSANSAPGGAGGEGGMASGGGGGGAGTTGGLGAKGGDGFVLIAPIF